MHPFYSQIMSQPISRTKRCPSNQSSFEQSSLEQINNLRKGIHHTRLKGQTEPSFNKTTALILAFLLSVIQISFTQTIFAQTTPPLSVADYGQLPFIDDVSISPDGKHYAFIQSQGEEQYFLIFNRQSNKVIGGANANGFKARNIFFATNKHVIIIASHTTSSVFIRNKWEESGAMSYNIETKKMYHLPKKGVDLYPAQSGLGYIVGVNREQEEAYMPAWVGTGNSPRRHLLKVNLNTGFARIHAQGRQSTLDWFVDKDGNVLAREDYIKSSQKHIIYSYTSGKAEKIYSKETSVPKISINSVSSDATHLVFVSNTNNDDAVYTMSLADGSIGPPKYAREDKDIDQILHGGIHRNLVGIRYSGPMPEYLFFDDNYDNTIRALEKAFPATSIWPVARSDDGVQTVLKVSGNSGSDDYFTYSADNKSLTKIAGGYRNIKVNQIAEVSAIRYPARDQLKIPAILTWPIGVEQRKLLPTLIFPHGGPESYDRIRFDWWAQYFAQKGYLILQPNFRGSTGYGVEFRNAGRGEWGRKMQDDVSDGVSALIKAGYADPNKVCIMGASYGGYSALAGGAFSPELYKCIISVAGVSDLPRMLQDEKAYHGRNHWVVSYWQNVIGDAKKEREKLNIVSPVNFAADFQAPVLLIHGKDDTVVHPRQSRRMHRALRKHEKIVKYVEIKGEDHWLSTSQTRMATLKAISEFLEEHNPPTDGSEVAGLAGVAGS